MDVSPVGEEVPEFKLRVEGRRDYHSRTMNRELLATAAPKWIEIQNFPAESTHRMLAMWIGAVIDAIGADHDEPDTWEVLYLSYALNALAKGMHYAALTFSQMVLIETSMHRAPILDPDGPRPVKLSELQHACELLAMRKP